MKSFDHLMVKTTDFIIFFYNALRNTLYDTQYPDHARTAASNVAKSLPPPPIL